jgi:hypothetical protein
MMTIVAFMLAAVQPAPPVVPSPDWRPLGSAGDRYRLYWDAASVERGPEVVSVRFKTEAMQSPESSPRAVSRLEIRCAASTVRVVETITYAPDGSVVRRDTTPVPFDTIPAGSLVAAIQRAVC